MRVSFSIGFLVGAILSYSITRRAFRYASEILDYRFYLTRAPLRIELRKSLAPKPLFPIA